MSAPRDIDGFLRECVKREDPYLALPAYDRAQGHELMDKIEAIILRSSRLRIAFSNMPFTPSSVLARLTWEANSAVCLRVARNPNTDGDTLDRIGENDSRLAIRRALASHPNASQHLLAKLEAGGDDSVRTLIARNSQASCDTLKEIFAHGPRELWATIARHPNADPEVIREIYERGDLAAQAEAIGNANCSAELLGAACVSPNPQVRRKCAGNPALPRELRLWFLDDLDPGVRAEALQALPGSSFDDLYSHIEESIQVRRRQARRADIHIALIERLSQDRDPWVRRWLARNPSAPLYVLDKLSRDEDPGVRRAVGRNTASPAPLLARLAGDRDAWVRAGVADRPDLPAEALVLLEKDSSVDVLSGVARNPRARPDALWRLASHADASVRRAVILNPSAPASVVRHLLMDDYPLNRALAVGHRNLGMDESWMCAADPEPQVRFAVGKRAATAL